MKLTISVVLVFYFCAYGARGSPWTADMLGKFAPLRQNDTTNAIESPSNPTLSTIRFFTEPPTMIPTSNATPEYDYLQNISIQDILSLGIDENDKIQKRIINAMIEFSSNYDKYKNIKLTTINYSLPQKFVQVNTTQGRVLFHDIVVSESYNTDYNRQHETIVGCDLPGFAKIQVSLPTEIHITAQIRVTSSEKITNEGSITIQFKNSALIKYLNLSPGITLEENAHSKIIYDESSVRVTIDSRFHKLIYKEVEVFQNELESSIGVFLSTQFDEEIAKRNISLVSSCSKLKIMKHDQKKINSLFNNHLNYLYVIPNVKLETWKSVTLKAGPVVIEGLSNFTSSETIVVDVDNFQTSTDYNKTLAIRVKTDALKGKCEWHYNSKQNDNNRTLLFFFSIDYIQFESKISRYYDQYARSGYPYNRGTEFKVRGPSIDVHMGEMQIKTSKSKSCEYEETFVNIVLTEYLKSIIVDSLKKSLEEEINSKFSSFLNTFDRN